MTTRLRRPVVVGVDGSEDGGRALRFAVGEARRLHCGVRLVTAIHEMVPVTPMLPVMRSESFRDAADRILKHARHEVEHLGRGTVDVETVLRYGPAVRTILDAAEDARLIVLGHRHVSGFERIFTGSTTAGVAARAICPVISVSTAWPAEHTIGRVTVGIDGSTHSSEVLRAAFEAASERDAALTVVHAWELPSAYADLVESSVTVQEWRDEVAPVIAEIMAGWRAEYPDVPVDIDLRYQRTVDALVDASAHSDLLVVGRHGGGGWAAGLTGVPVGSVARAVLAHAHCPVEIAPHRREHQGDRRHHRAGATQHT